MSGWNDLLVGTASFDSAPVEKLSGICTAAESEQMTLGQGISAIGTVLAIAAQNKDAGLPLDAVADLGWLLESLGKLSGSVIDRGNAARSYMDWHAAKKGEE